MQTKKILFVAVVALAFVFAEVAAEEAAEGVLRKYY